ncbi:MAG: hypothetical protein ABIQ95_06165 [Bdellovibrionia bacterium]
MRKTLALIVALCVGSAIGGCSKSNNNKDNKVAPPVEEVHVDPNWELKLQSKCPENVPHENCLGDFGFTVLTNGHYQIGPGPKKEIREGSLTPEELSLLSSALAPSLAAADSADADNHQNIDAGESDDVVTLTRGASSLAVLLKTKGTDLYYANSSVDDAKTIHNVVRKLALKYYALPFPDACIDGATTLQSFYSSLQSCNIDADCTYMDGSFNVIPSNSAEWVITDDCSMLHPLAVANSTSVVSNQDKLVESLNELRNSCGEKFQRQGCTQQIGFQPNNQSPMCSQGTCQARPTSSTSLR